MFFIFILFMNSFNKQWLYIYYVLVIVFGIVLIIVNKVKRKGEGRLGDFKKFEVYFNYKGGDWRILSRKVI